MALKKFKPKTSSTRFKVNLDNNRLVKNKIEKKLLCVLNKSGGRNNFGKITVNHIGGGCKRRYRKVLFKRKPFKAIVVSFEYDPNRTAYLAKIYCMPNSLHEYIIAPKYLLIGDSIEYGSNIIQKNNGSSTCLLNIPIGGLIHNIEIKPGKGGQLVRSAGCFATLIEKLDKYARIRLSSGEQRLVSLFCYASLGVIDNGDHKHISLGKAGKSRWLGIRPTVRGVAMNPVDHPHGGGQGKTSGGRPSVTPRGLPTKGQPTKKNINKNILISVQKLRDFKQNSTRKGKFSY